MTFSVWRVGGPRPPLPPCQWKIRGPWADGAVRRQWLVQEDSAVFRWAAPGAGLRVVGRFMLIFTEPISPVGIIALESQALSPQPSSELRCPDHSWRKRICRKEKKENPPKQLLQTEAYLTILWFIYMEKFIFWIFYSPRKRKWIPFRGVQSRRKGVWHIWDIVRGPVFPI